jgi:formamidase
VRIAIDRRRPLHEGGEGGHNRWSPDLEPIARVAGGTELTLELRDARDGQLTHESRHRDLLELEHTTHPLTGPVYVEDAEPGDLLEVEILGYETDDFAWTAIWPGSGVLGDLFSEPYLTLWELREGVARSPSLPGVAVTGAPFAGVAGVAPSPELSIEMEARERDLADRGGRVELPQARGAAPPGAAGGLRTIPPRENGGNIDVRDLVAGSRLWLPVFVPGALLSVGDLHFAQGDGEVCISAIETGGSVTVRVSVVKGEGWRPRFPAWESPPRPGRRMFATTGIPLDDQGRNADMDLGLATRRALIEMLDWLTRERGLEREAAYVLMSAAVELRISEAVDVPNALVSAALPLDVFEDD